MIYETIDTVEAKSLETLMILIALRTPNDHWPTPLKLSHSSMITRLS